MIENWLVFSGVQVILMLNCFAVDQVQQLVGEIDEKETAAEDDLCDIGNVFFDLILEI